MTAESFEHSTQRPGERPSKKSKNLLEELASVSRREESVAEYATTLHRVSGSKEVDGNVGDEVVEMLDLSNRVGLTSEHPQEPSRTVQEGFCLEASL